MKLPTLKNQVLLWESFTDIPSMDLTINLTMNLTMDLAPSMDQTIRECL